MTLTENEKKMEKKERTEATCRSSKFLADVYLFRTHTKYCDFTTGASLRR